MTGIGSRCRLKAAFRRHLGITSLILIPTRWRQTKKQGNKNMSARAEFEPLSWEEAEENRREALPQILPDPRQRDLSQDGEQGSLAFAMSGSRSPIGTQENWRALLQRRDQLGREIKKGKERLEDIQKELMESRLVLEQWPGYEKQCGRNPLPHLMQSVAAKEHF